ncbi:MAG: hypothetical protein ABI890_04425 [Lapillicoccus sp.]
MFGRRELRSISPATLAELSHLVAAMPERPPVTVPLASLRRAVTRTDAGFARA